MILGRKVASPPAVFELYPRETMTHELEELLSAAKVMAMENNVIEVERLHKAITAFEAAMDKRASIIEFPIRVQQVPGMRNLIIEHNVTWVEEPECTDCGGTGITYQTERRCSCQGENHGLDNITKTAASDPYDFENQGLRKEP
jgi:hypothetical protein